MLWNYAEVLLVRNDLLLKERYHVPDDVQRKHNSCRRLNRDFDYFTLSRRRSERRHHVPTERDREVLRSRTRLHKIRVDRLGILSIRATTDVKLDLFPLGLGAHPHSVCRPTAAVEYCVDKPKSPREVGASGGATKREEPLAWQSPP